MNYCALLKNHQQGIEKVLSEKDKRFSPFLEIVRALRDNDEDRMYENITTFIYSFTDAADVICVLNFLSRHLGSVLLYRHVAQEFLENYVLDGDTASRITPAQLDRIVRLAYPVARPRMAEDDRLTWLITMYEMYNSRQEVIPTILYCLRQDHSLVLPFVRNYLTRFDTLDRRILELLRKEDNQTLFGFVTNNIMGQLSARSPERHKFPFHTMTAGDKKRLLQWAYTRKKSPMAASEIRRRQIEEALVIYNRLRDTMRPESHAPVITLAELRERVRKISNTKIRSIILRLLKRDRRKALDNLERDRQNMRRRTTNIKPKKVGKP